jgi:hypothetical protein
MAQGLIERNIVNRISRTHIRRGPVAICMAMAAMLLLGTASAQAATNTYPAGDGTFTGGPQGWQVTEASCNVPALCTASGGYDAVNGNPPGSLTTDTTIGLNLLTLFKSTVTMQSPDFTVSDAGDGTLHLDRQFVPGNLVDLAASATYTATLIDRTAGASTKSLVETLDAASPFTGKDVAATVVPGHTYAISITTEVTSSVVGTGLLGGTTSTRFDNVALRVQSSAGGGSGGGGGNNGGGGGGNSGASSLSDQQLTKLMANSLIGPATLKGRKLSVKVKCPAKVGVACRISLQGLLKKGKAATSTRTAKVGKGKTKRFVLQVKPKARQKLVKRKKLLFKQTVRAGSAKATVYKRLKLVRKGS